jgi:hypothetical protein
MKGPRYFKWIASVCDLLGWPRQQGTDLLNDTNWWNCFDVGMDPLRAAMEAKERGVLIQENNKWVYRPENYGQTTI